MTLLDFERSNIAGAVAARRQLRQLIGHIRDDAQGAAGRISAGLRRELAERWIETEALYQFSFRIISMQNNGLVPNYEASTAKLYASELNQRIARTALKVFGLHANHWAAAPPASAFTRNYIAQVPATIRGGTSEVQRNVIATRGLGSPPSLTMPNSKKPRRKTPRRHTRRSSSPNPAAQEQQPAIRLRLGDDPPPAAKEPNEAPPPEPEISRQIQAAIEAWADSLIDTGARNPLIYYRHLRAGTLDLGPESGADQSGVSRLINGTRLLLFDLFPEDEHQDVRRRARVIRGAALANSEERNISTLHLAHGMATWRQDDAAPQPNAPIFLAEAKLNPVGRVSDGFFNVELEDDWKLNANLLHLLQTDFGIELSEEEFADSIEPSSFDAIFKRLQRACEEIADFEIRPATVLANFAYAKLPMVRDLQSAGPAVAAHPLVAALAGDPAAIERIRAMYAPGDPVIAGGIGADIPPQNEFLVLDADGTQSAVIRAALAGNHLVVVGPPGTGKSQTIANLIAELATDGKAILFVAEKRAAIDAVTKRLNNVGLGDLVLDLHESRRSRGRTAQQLEEALHSARTAPPPNVDEIHTALEQSRDALNIATEALHRPLEPWERSMFDVQASLLAMSEHEKLSIRLRGKALDALAAGPLEDARRQLRQYVSHYHDAFRHNDSLRAAFDVDAVRTSARADELVRTLAEMRENLPELREAEQSFEAEPAWGDVREAGTARTRDQAEALIQQVEKTRDMRQELEDASRNFEAAQAWRGVEQAGRIRTRSQAERLITRINGAVKTTRDLRNLTESFEEIGAWRAVLDGSPPRTPPAVATLLRAVEEGSALIPALRSSAADLANRIGAAVPSTLAEADALIRRADRGLAALVRRDAAAAHFTGAAGEIDLQGLAEALEPAREGFVGRLRAHLSRGTYRGAKSTLRQLAVDPATTLIEGQERILELSAARDAVRDAGAPLDAVTEDYSADTCADDLRALRRALAPLERAVAISVPEAVEWDGIEGRLAALHADAGSARLLPRIIELRQDLASAIDEIETATAALGDRQALDPHSLANLEETFQDLADVADALRLLPRMIELRKSIEVSLASLRDAKVLPRSRHDDWPAIDARLDELEAGSGALLRLPRIIELESALAAGLKQLRAAKLVPRSRRLDQDAFVAELAALNASAQGLRLLPRLHLLRRRLDDAKLNGLREQVLKRGWSPDAAVRAFDRVYMLSIHSVGEARLPRLAHFKASDQNAHTDRFREADTEHIQQGAARVRRAWGVHVTSARNQHGEQTRLIEHEARKKRRHRSTRDLLAEAPDVLTALKPCWAMSPLVVAQLLPASPPPFDVVIFDEASQIPPADAISSLLRGRQAIVAGDPKQLPPTAFFTQSGDDDDEREDADEELLTDDVESILDAMSTLLSSPRANKSLGWHYRSKDERLIAFANHHVYDGRMTTFPGALGDDCISHVEVPFSPRAVQQRGSNSAEVERVVQLILEHARERPGESLGVIAFGSHHAIRIEETLLQARRERPDLDEFFSEAAGEPFFVKNLERVQGDERDAIILSVGYGRGADGRMRYAFGPINQEGGYRRLNVAITRAKRRMTVVSAFSPHDLDPDRIRTQGPGLLRAYIAYAASRGADLGRVDLDKPPLNDFERDIKRRLEAEGIRVEPQYGASGYRIDFAAFHPEQPGRPVLAIEADGAAYHSAPSARDRDRLRQEHLERLGWRFHRIWSTEYFRRPEQEIARAVAAWQSAVAAADAPEPEPVPAPAEPAARAEPDPPPPQPQRGPKPNVGPKRPITEFSARQIREIIDWVDSDNILRTQEETIQEVSRALGFQRRGSRIDAAISNALLQHRRSPPSEPPPQTEDQAQPPENFRFTTRF